MSSKERIRLDALARVKRKQITVVEAAELMGLSVRQSRRVWGRYKKHGDAGLVHQLRGRTGNRRLSQAMQDRIVKLHQEHYSDFGPTFACEKLAQHGLWISPNTLTALLKQRKLWVPRRHRDKHRQRRERRACFGSMIQMDGSEHDWFEGRCGPCTLMVLIDDATSRTYARFYPAETTEAAFDAFGRWARMHGLPRSLYVDKDSIYRNAEHPERLTQFARAMKELDVELICAHSPQAKGRVERRNAVFQDRLVKEMRLRGICDMAQANDLLEGLFLAELNRRLAIQAAQDQDLHRALGAEVVLEEVLCVQEQRVVGQDWCVRWHNLILQIDPRHAGLSLAKRRVLVKELPDGRLRVEHQGRALTVTELSARPRPAKPKKPIVNNRRYKPSADHPWNRGSACRSASRASPAPATPARDLHAKKTRKAG